MRLHELKVHVLTGDKVRRASWPAWLCMFQIPAAQIASGQRGHGPFIFLDDGNDFCQPYQPTLEDYIAEDWELVSAPEPTPIAEPSPEQIAAFREHWNREISQDNLRWEWAMKRLRNAWGWISHAPA